MQLYSIVLGYQLESGLLASDPVAVSASRKAVEVGLNICLSASHVGETVEAPGFGLPWPICCGHLRN